MEFDAIKTGRERGKCKNCGRKEADHGYAGDGIGRTCDPADITARARTLKRREADRERRAALNDAMGSIGMVRVKGTNGGTYWE